MGVYRALVLVAAVREAAVGSDGVLADTDDTVGGGNAGCLFTADNRYDDDSRPTGDS